MRASFQLFAVNSIFVETLPLLKRLFGIPVVIFGIPSEHFRLVFDAGAFAVRFDDARWVVEQVIRVNDANLYARVWALGFRTVRAGGNPGSSMRANLSLGTKEIEETTQLNITSLVGAEVVETRDFVEWGDCAAVVAWNAVLWMADQKREVELRQQVFRDHGWIAGFGFRFVRVRRSVFVCSGGGWGESRGVRSDISVVVHERWRNSSRFFVRWDPVLRHILDKCAFALHRCEYAQCPQ
jgi:hypothetical protein